MEFLCNNNSIQSEKMTSFNTNLFASIDMGTNSFKLLIIQTDSITGRFIALNRLKEPVILGRDIAASSKISAASHLLSIEALSKFQEILRSNRVPPSQTRFIATSAVREALNRSEFTAKLHQTLGLEIDVLSGEEEARLSYIGVLQFHHVFHRKVLTIDIGGGSTEFVIGKRGKVIVGISLKLGHVTLTEEFLKTGEFFQLEYMREHIRTVIRKSGLIEKVAEERFDIVIGSSGTVRSIEKAIFYGYGGGLMDDAGILFAGDHRRDWRFLKEELVDLVRRLYLEEGSIQLRDKFFKRRSEFIMAGAVLLEEIFVALGISEMVVSGYALGEGVIAENMSRILNGFDFNANARWNSVVRLAKRFNNKKRMKSAALCSRIAKELFQGLKKLNDGLDDKDGEYLEAACLLHNIGLFMCEKGYHKQSYKIIMNGEHLHGYNNDEVEIIALLARHHRKKFPKLDNHSFGFNQEVKQKFRMLCIIIRLSTIIEQNFPNVKQIVFSHSDDEGFKMVLHEVSSPELVQSSQNNVKEKIDKEIEQFRVVLSQKLTIILPSRTSELS